MAVEDIAQGAQSRTEQQRDAPKPPPPLQPRTRSPKALEAAKADGSRQGSPLSHPPVRPALGRTPSAIAYGHTMYGVGVSDSCPPLAAPRPKQELDKEELTTKGRKRKRLAKACSACHVSCHPSQQYKSIESLTRSEKQASLRWICALLQLRVLGSPMHLPQRPGRTNSSATDPGLVGDWHNQACQ